MKKLYKRLTMFLSLCMFCTLMTPMKAYAAERTVAINTIVQTPKVKKDGKQEAKANITNQGNEFDAWAKIKVANQKPYVVEVGKIIAGSSDVIIPVTDTHDILNPGETAKVKIDIYDNEKCTGSPMGTYTTKEWQRTRHWEFYLSQTMHTDLGYTNYQEDLKPLFSTFLDTVKEYMKNSDDRESDVQKYKYAIESSWVMGEGYMTERNADEIQEILDLIEEDRMTIGAGRFNYTMECFSTEETARAAYYTNRYLVDKLGIDPSTTERMFDNPSFSKSYVDIANSAGIKYGLHSMNPDRSPYHQKKLYDLYYMEGMNPENKLLIFNGKTYGDNYRFGGDHWDPNNGSVEGAEQALKDIITDLESRTGRAAYPYDKFPLPLIPYGDNKQPMELQIQIANDLNKKYEDAGYAYPRVTSAFPETFFEEVEKEYGDMIPTETGTEENWWNDGWGTTAYESGTNKEAGALLPVAESAASFASILMGEEYPYDDLYEGVERNLTYDEHTWGYAGYDNSKNYNNQFEWKRSNAFGAKTLAEKVLNNSLDALASNVNTSGKAIYVYNPLNWERNDVVTINDLSGLPTSFEIKDGEKSIPYTIENGVLTFIAPSVPALGYKTFIIKEVTTKPTFESKVTSGDNFMENDFYKVTFANDGTISSIIDKKNTNREIVDDAATIKFNQYQYYDDFGIPHTNMGADFSEDKWDLYVPEEDAGSLDITTDGVSATAKLDTTTFRAKAITQKVTLYNDIPRIDITNEVVKDSLPSLQSKEEAFYTFPFKSNGEYEIRYDLPIGNTAEGEQVYGTSTDWYTANKWVNVQDKSDNYNMTLAIPNSALLQFGERRTGNWSFDYKSENPYIYSYIFNNMWHTNFQGDQPGYADFRYSISTNKSVGMEEATRFGWEISTPLQATVIKDEQSEVSGKSSDSYIKISSDNIQLSTMKSAEANGDGMIVRFAEIEGKDTKNVKVTLPFKASSIYETDIIENNIGEETSGNKITFDIPAYGVKTFRVVNGTSLEEVTDLQAISSISKDKNNLSLNATVSATSVFDDNYSAENAKVINEGKEWACKNVTEGTITFKWEEPVQVQTIRIQDRKTNADNIKNAIIKINGEEKIIETGALENEKIKDITLDKAMNIYTLEIFVQGNLNVGLDGVELYGPGVDLTTSLEGTKVSWNPVNNALYYEVFRGKTSDFTPGKGNYLGTTKDTTYFDTQVMDGLKGEYYYTVRAAGSGVKGNTCIPIKPTVGDIKDDNTPEVPILEGVAREENRIDLYWTPVKDDVMISHYEIYRDGEKIGQTPDNYVTTYRDKTVARNTNYEYTVKAIDINGKEAESNKVSVTSLDLTTVTLSELKVDIGTLSPKFDKDTGSYRLNVGDNFGYFEGVKVTAICEDEGAKITINRMPVESGVESEVIPVKEGDKIVVKVENVEGERKIYNIVATTNDPIIAAVDAKTGSEYGPNQGLQNPIHLIDNSGMSGRKSLKDTHDNEGGARTMWHTDANPGKNAWVSIDLGDTYKLDEMWVWNMNQSNSSNRGLKNVKIQYSTDNSNWTDLAPSDGMTFTDGVEGYPFQFAQGTGNANLKATNLNDGANTPVDFGGNEARYVRIIADPGAGIGSWGDVYFGLSEVRFTRYMELDNIKPVEEIIVSAEGDATTIIESGGSLQMNANVLPEDATKKNVIWSLTDVENNKTDIAKITTEGLLTARKNGTVKVIATAKDGSGVVGSCDITIEGQKAVIENVSAKAGNEYNGQWAMNIVNNSGMSGIGSVADTHDNDTNAVTMWHTNQNPGETAWIEFDLGHSYVLDEMWIWNENQPNNGEYKRGFRNVKIEYSEDGDTWKNLSPDKDMKFLGETSEDYPFQFASGNGKPELKATNLNDGGNSPVIFNGEKARYIKVTANPTPGIGNWSKDQLYYGLSEVRFTYK